jgi:hypothetical protein
MLFWLFQDAMQTLPLALFDKHWTENRKHKYQQYCLCGWCSTTEWKSGPHANLYKYGLWLCIHGRVRTTPDHKHSSTGKAELTGDEPLVNPLWVLLCISSTWFWILALIMASTILLITGSTVRSSSKVYMKMLSASLNGQTKGPNLLM